MNKNKYNFNPYFSKEAEKNRKEFYSMLNANEVQAVRENKRLQFMSGGTTYRSEDDEQLVRRLDHALKDNTSERDMIDKVAKSQDTQLLHNYIETLSPREQKILNMRFGLKDGIGRTLEEVGKEFGLTRDRIRQIEARALVKLREMALEDNKLNAIKNQND